MAAVLTASSAGLLLGAGAQPAAAMWASLPASLAQPGARGNMPFVAQVTREFDEGGEGSCTGSLVATTWVLTAAHCVTDNDGTQMQTYRVSVRVGNTTRDVGGQLRRVVRIVRYPGWTNNFTDVALLEFWPPITGIQPAQIPFGKSYLYDGVGDDRAQANGWGRLKDGTLPTEQQTKLLSVDGVASDGRQDTAVWTSSGPCKGDSGGPLMVADSTGQRWLAGVASTGDGGIGGYCSLNSAGYTDVGSGPVRSWTLVNMNTVNIPGGSKGYTPFGVADYDGDGYRDTIAREDATGILWLYPGNGVRGYPSSGRYVIGTGWNGYTPFGIADYDEDGNMDVIAREDGTGILWLYPGNSTRSYPTDGRYVIGTGWNGYTPFGVARWDGDSYPDVLARNDSTGDLWLYPGNGDRSYPTDGRFLISTVWNGVTPFGIVDYDQDGHSDLIGRYNDTGNLVLYRGQSLRGSPGTYPSSLTVSNLPSVQIGNGWTGFTPFGVADYDRDGAPDIMARSDYTRDLWLYPGPGTWTVPRVKIGNAW